MRRKKSRDNYGEYQNKKHWWEGSYWKVAVVALIAYELVSALYSLGKGI